MADGIQPNPLLALLPEPREVSGSRPTDEPQARMWTAVTALVALIRAMLGLFEFHIETVTAAGTRIPHRLGRRPFGRIILWQSENTVVFDDYEKWTTEHVRLYTAARSCRVAFALIALLVALAPPAGAVECATYGYAEGEPVRFWLCDAATDTTTGAAEGDYRYNKDTNAVLSYDGAAWNAVGGGGGAPTNAQYWVGAADATLSAEHNLGGLATGLVINTTGTPSAYTGTSCTNQFPRSLSASGAATCASVASADFGANILAVSNGGTGIDTSATGVNRLLMTGAVGTWTAYNIPDCDDTGGQHLNYNTVAGGGPTFSCGTSSASSTPTGTGYYHVTAGVMDAAADLVTLTSASDVAANQGTTTTVLHGNAAGQASFASVVSADMNITTTSCTNQFVTAISAGAVGTCTTDTLASAQHANQGTTTTVLHGNAAGNPSWGSVDLANDTSSTLPLAKLTDDGLGGLCLISGGAGDPFWDTCPGGGGGLSYAQVAAAVLGGM